MKSSVILRCMLNNSDYYHWYYYYVVLGNGVLHHNCFVLLRLDFKIPDSGVNRLWGTGSDLFRIFIFEVLESEFIITLYLEFFGFEIILALELEASGSDWTTISNLAPSGTKKVFNPSLIHSQHALRLVSFGFPSENPIPLPLFL